MGYRTITDRDSPNYNPGRPWGPPNEIVIHHWGRDGQDFWTVVNWLCNPDSGASAHAVAQDGLVAWLVNASDRAWHAGRSGNPRGIGIECRPEMTPGDFETVAELIANIRETYGPLPLAGHQEHMATACPGRWQAQLARLSARADEITHARNNPQPQPKKEGLTMADISNILAAISATEARLNARIDAVAKLARQTPVIDARVKGALQLLTNGKATNYHDTAAEKAWGQLDSITRDLAALRADMDAVIRDGKQKEEAK